MAFVPSTALTSSVQAASPSSLRNDLTTSLRPTTSSSTATAAVRMGYGDYSYLTDKTKGHVNQYYVDKFRTISDFARGVPQSAGDAMLGRNLKGGVYIPSEGIPQLVDTPEIPILSNVEPDPRIVETEGSLYPWDINYVKPEFQPDTYQDLDDPDVADDALAKFRSSVAMDRSAALSAMDFGAAARINRLKKGTMEESYMMTLDGQLDIEYAKVEKIAFIPSLNPTGIPQTEIPGYPYLKAVGALDFQGSSSIAFWKSDDAPVEKSYKKSSGAELPELPYNTAPTNNELLEAQEARDIVPKTE